MKSALFFIAVCIGVNAAVCASLGNESFAGHIVEFRRYPMRPLNVITFDSSRTPTFGTTINFGSHVKSMCEGKMSMPMINRLFNTVSYHAAWNIIYDTCISPRYVPVVRIVLPRIHISKKINVFRDDINDNTTCPFTPT